MQKIKVTKNIIDFTNLITISNRFYEKLSCDELEMLNSLQQARQNRDNDENFDYELEIVD